MGDENTNMTGAGGGGGVAAAAALVKVPVQQPTKFIHFVIHAHGSIPFGQCPARFQVPQNMSIGFFYNPSMENTTVCFTPDKISQICFGEIDAPYKYEHPNEVPNILLERMDNIKLPTGIFNCNEQKFMPIPTLGPVEPMPFAESAFRPSACLETVIQVLQYQYPDYFIAITVLACGVTSKFKINPERMKTVYPEVGAKVVRKTNTNQITTMAQNYMSRGFSYNQAMKLAVQSVRQAGGRTRTRKQMQRVKNTRRIRKTKKLKIMK